MGTLFLNLWPWSNSMKIDHNLTITLTVSPELIALVNSLRQGMTSAEVKQLADQLKAHDDKLKGLSSQS